MAPMTRAFSLNNVPNDAVVEYYRLRAAGGVGLIITEGTCVNHKAAHITENIPNFHGEEALAGWKKVVDAVHAEGGKIAPQLWHGGAIRQPGTNPGGDTLGYGPSGKAMPGSPDGHTMTKEDIDEVIAAFAQAAADAEAIGFDAVEIHGAHGYLIDQFFWDGTNDRDDEYGGNQENRSRFAIEIIKAMRAVVSPDFPIILRWSQWKQQDYSVSLTNTPEELAAFLQPLSDAGVDIFHSSTRRFWEPEFEGSDLTLAGWTKKITGKPTIAVGSVGLNNDFISENKTDMFKSAEPASLDNLTVRMHDNEFDLIAVGRALIANPDWADQVRQGNFDSLAAFEKEHLGKLV